jgi:hypothetical protein
VFTRVRKLIASVLIFVFAAVPAAFAASAALPDGESPELATAPLLDRPFAEQEKQQRRAAARKRAKRRAAERRARRVEARFKKVELPAQLASIAACESHGNPRAIGGGGAYRGKYQFSYSTWAGVGGSGDPAAASEAEQDYRAALLYQRSGAGQWPVCGS